MNQPLPKNPSAEPAWPSAGSAWSVVGVLTVAYVFSFIDRSILQLLVAPIRRDLGISDTQISLLMGFSFAVFYTLFGIPMGRLADTRSRRTIIGIGIVVWSLMTAACGLARNYLQLVLARIGVGVGEATLSPSAYSLIADYFPPERRATALGVYSMGIYLGGGVATLIGALVVKVLSTAGKQHVPVLGEVWPWQLVFVTVGLAGGLYSVVLVTVKEPPRRGVRTVQAMDGTAQQVKLTFGEVFAYLGSIRKSFLCLNLGFAILALSGYGYGAWLPTFFVRKHGWTAPHAATVVGILSILCGTAGVLAGGRIADYLRRRGVKDANLRVGLYAAMAGLPFAALLCLLPNADMAAWMLAPTLFIAGLPIPAAGAAIQEIVPNEMRGQATAIFLFASNLIGLGLGPTAVALLTDYLFHNDNMINYSMLLVILFAHGVSSVLLWSGLRPYVQSIERLSGWVLRSSNS